jgi:hypothetical protein
LPVASGRTPMPSAPLPRRSSNCGLPAAPRPGGARRMQPGPAPRSRRTDRSWSGTVLHRPGDRPPRGLHAMSRRSGRTCYVTAFLRCWSHASAHRTWRCEAVRSHAPMLEARRHMAPPSRHVLARRPAALLGSCSGAPPGLVLPGVAAPSWICRQRSPAHASAGRPWRHARMADGDRNTGTSFRRWSILVTSHAV